MKRYVFFAILLCATALAWAGRTINDSLPVAKRNRAFRMYLPDSLKEDAPLLFVLHGYGRSVNDVPNEFYRTADKYGFALCIPEGLRDLAGKPGWNVKYPKQVGWNVNDEKDLVAIAQHVQEKYKLSKKNTFLSGMSNGGDMCYVMAYSEQTTFKGFASIVGQHMLWSYKERKQSRPVPFMEIHGTADRVSCWEGDMKNKYGWNPYLPVTMAVQAIAGNNGCPIEEVTTEQGLPNAKFGPIVKHRYSGKDVPEVILYEVKNGQHGWFDTTMDVCDTIWQFFQKYIE